MGVVTGGAAGVCGAVKCVTTTYALAGPYSLIVWVHCGDVASKIVGGNFDMIGGGITVRPGKGLGGGDVTVMPVACDWRGRRGGLWAVCERM